MRTMFSLALFLLSAPAFSQGWPPQLPDAPQTGAFTRYDNLYDSHPNKTAAVPSKGSTNNSRYQPPDPFPSSETNKQRVEQEKREALLSSLEALDQRSKTRTVQDADLDTVFGHPPVVSQSVYEATKQFWDALLVLTDMAEGKRRFSLTEAIYTVENAYMKNGMSRNQFYSAIQSRAELARQIMKREQLDTGNNLAKNFAIQRQFEQQNKFFQSKTGKVIAVPKLEYDFNDFMGDSSHAQMFVSKLLATGKGQCHSMPLLYLAVAEQLNAKAYLSFSPEHSFIRFSDDDGSQYNFETTSGAVVSDKWMTRSGYITTTAIKNKIYLDTVSQKQLLALCIYDLAMGYIYDHGYDGFTETALRYALPLDPRGIQGNIILGNFWAAKTGKAIRYLNLATKEQFEQNAIAKALQKRMLQTYGRIDGLGYQKMPKEAYAEWLRTINEEKEKQDQRELQQQLRQLMKKK